MELIYLLDKNEYETHLVKKKKEYILYSWNTLKLYVNEWQGGMLILDSKKLNIETFFDEKKRLLYRCLKLDEEAYKDFMPYQFKGIKHCLMNTSMIDEKWCYPILSDNVNIIFTKNDRLKITNFDHIYSSRESRTSFVL